MRLGLGLILLMGCNGGVEPVEGAAPGPDPTTPTVAPPTTGARSVPLYGGTMQSDGSFTVVADPSRDVIGVLEGTRQRVVQLAAGSEPFRVALHDLHAFVTLRGSGEVLSLDHTGAILERTRVCPQPRGVAATSDTVLVACSSGELVQLDPGSLEIERSEIIQADLRDVVIEGDQILLSRFRSAEVLRLDTDWAVTAVHRPALHGRRGDEATPRVAWRMIPHPTGGVLFSHQAHLDDPIDLEEPNDNRGEGAYGGSDCFEGPTGVEDGGPPLSSHVTHIDAEGAVRTTGDLFGLSTPVDLAIDPESGLFAVVGRGIISQSVVVFDLENSLNTPEGCAEPHDFRFARYGSAIAFANQGDLTIFDRHQGRIDGERTRFSLPNSVVPDTASSELHFHLPPGAAALSCASCHPEGQDDGHTWAFEGLGLRRTQNLAGGLTNRGAFHWDAEFDSLDALMDDVFTQRMSGPDVMPSEVEALGTWLDGIRPEQASSDEHPSVLDHGKALFESAEVGCTGCHSGPQYADHQMHRIASWAEPTKTPPLLGVGTRAPYMHTGCAETLLERFDTECGGDQHGDLTGLDESDRRALAAYVSTL